MRDVQKTPDTRNIAIDKVGVKNIRYPIVVMDKSKARQHTVARVNMYVDLPHHFKGTHMSRFIEVLNLYHGEISIESLDTMLREMKQRLEASRAHLELDFPYFIEKSAPVSGARSLMEYQCRMIGILGEEQDFVLGVSVPVTSLCPCSRDISARGAHNQRSLLSVQIRYQGHVWIEDLVSWLEQCASAPVYALLKREDEKAVTEQAYDNPMFVEDIVRAVTQKLSAVPEITWFQVECENFESIHNHSAYALVESHARPL
ncbi:GTP cyclohydrolase I [Geoalkalibacter ferrihydriticus]|uniref:GTP cyclohydrolase FolE2 n=2 Tax=Geoalkalibacter ferrihydriticus TaxID=392333 RepID=A0A0C2HY47_9BACT|nr:GTP cyclohydrolase FolE2 [Geoalkalibacter ferrihydriticus]KIH77647.1 GTP cyclohydrolase [Geoalkalibacter ferrihydriticus DSM 17813]SDL71909.1 GTP cyclohydrolase I [Geoalkalibacter ferrihydriticus]